MANAAIAVAKGRAAAAVDAGLTKLDGRSILYQSSNLAS
jgi:hypothetical protein